tara:strand:+ start:638 stop:1402 length:765 start_codon:yes stop_codon:yes gene_type:complete
MDNIFDDDNSRDGLVIDNCVGSFNLGIDYLDLDRLKFLDNFIYNRSRFAAGTLRLRDTLLGTVTVLLFSSGKVVITGGRNAYNLNLLSFRVVRFLNIRCLIRCRMVDFKVSNLVVSGRVPSDLIPGDFEDFHAKCNLNVNYKRSLFPGICYRSNSTLKFGGDTEEDNTNVSVLLFHSGIECILLVFCCFDILFYLFLLKGRVVLSGCKKFSNGIEEYNKLLSMLRHYKDMDKVDNSALILNSAIDECNNNKMNK